MKNYKDYKQYFTQEEWEKFEANMKLKKHFKRDALSGWGYEIGLEDYRKDTINKYIDSCFPWDETLEGHDYWNTLQNTLRKRYDSTT